MARRETNAERRAREYEKAERVWIARCIASGIVLGKKHIEDSDPIWIDNYAKLGQILCMCDEKVLYMVVDMLKERPRLVTDIFYGKSPHNPGDHWYNNEIKAAWAKAFGRTIEKLPQGSLQNIFSPGFAARD